MSVRGSSHRLHWSSKSNKWENWNRTEIASTSIVIDNQEFSITVTDINVVMASFNKRAVSLLLRSLDKPTRASARSNHSLDICKPLLLFYIARVALTTASVRSFNSAAATRKEITVICQEKTREQGNWSQTSLYADSRKEISLVRSCTTKRIPPGLARNGKWNASNTW